MESNFDAFVDQVNQEVWEGYSRTVFDHANNPRNGGMLEDYNGYGSTLGECGDSMEIWVQVNDRMIQKISFWTDGCGATIACGSMVTELAKNKPLEEAFEIDAEGVIKGLDGLPPGNEHCARLAVNTLTNALRNYIEFKNEPWKRIYRRK